MWEIWQWKAPHMGDIYSCSVSSNVPPTPGLLLRQLNIDIEDIGSWSWGFFWMFLILQQKYLEYSEQF